MHAGHWRICIGGAAIAAVGTGRIASHFGHRALLPPNSSGTLRAAPHEHDTRIGIGHSSIREPTSSESTLIQENPFTAGPPDWGIHIFLGRKRDFRVMKYWKAG